MTDHLIFLTGKLAKISLEKVLSDISTKNEFTHEVLDIGVNVAALATIDIIIKKITVDKLSRALLNLSTVIFLIIISIVASAATFTPISRTSCVNSFLVLISDKTFSSDIFANFPVKNIKWSVITSHMIELYILFCFSIM